MALSTPLSTSKFFPDQFVFQIVANDSTQSTSVGDAENSGEVQKNALLTGIGRA